MTAWTNSQVPDQSGRTALITGANSGIGLDAARVLARKGAHVVLACRNQAKAVEAQRSIESAGTESGKKASVEILPLDLSSQSAVREAAAAFRATHSRLDLLINNAGVMWLPRTLTVDGHETQFGTNHLGHFAFTGLLMDLLLATPQSRVVTVSSIAHASGKIHFDDLSFEKTPYGKQRSYGQSKVANLLFALELARRLKAKNAGTQSIGCHPGVSATNLFVAGYEMRGAKLLAILAGIATQIIAQSSEKGALPTLYAATSPDAKNGDYIGPSGYRQMRGSPQKVVCTRYARNEEVARKLWEVSEALTGVRY